MFIFETERLIVREFTDTNEDAGYFFMVNGDDVVTRYIRKPLTRQDSDNFLKLNIKFYKQNKNLGRWCVTEKATGRFAGSFALIYLPFEDESDIVQIGYALIPAAWGKGYATELTKAGTDFYFNMHQSPVLHAITALQNVASRKVLLKCGFTENGKKLHDGKLVQRYLLEKNSPTTKAL